MFCLQADWYAEQGCAAAARQSMNDAKDFVRSFFPQMKVEQPQEPSMSVLMESILQDDSARLRLCAALGIAGISCPSFMALFDLAGQKYQHHTGLHWERQWTGWLRRSSSQDPVRSGKE